jgi:hypothetical protein
MIRLTLLLVAGIAGAMLVFGTESEDVSKAPIVETVLASSETPEGAPAPAPKAEVVQAAVDPVTLSLPRVEMIIEKAVATTAGAEAAVEQAVARIPAAVAEVAARADVTRTESLDLTRVKPITTAVESAMAAVMEPRIVRVTGSSVNLRAGPSTSTSVLARLTRDARAEVLDEAADGWFRIRDLASGTEGFMSGDFLTAVNPG